MTATIHISKGSKGVWFAAMAITKGDTVEMYNADGPKVAAVMLKLTNTLIQLDTKESRILVAHEVPPPAGET